MNVRAIQNVESVWLLIQATKNMFEIRLLIRSILVDIMSHRIPKELIYSVKVSLHIYLWIIPWQDII